jgi:ribosomal protein S18 acetylase RimI-like enzyme
MTFDPAAIDPRLLLADRESARIEEAGINAAQPPEQLLVDGWLLRFSSGKAKRARSVSAISSGRLDLHEKLRICRAYCERSGMPLIFRVTPFSQPAGLDRFLREQGFVAFDESRVMVCTLGSAHAAGDANPGCEFRRVDVDAFAAFVGALRDSPAEQIGAHVRRLRASPLQEASRRLAAYVNGQLVAAGQMVAEGDLAGLYDVVTAPAWRSRGFGTALTARLLAAAKECGARKAYLQVDAGNEAARRVYDRLGFVDRYAYWYRQPASSFNEHA